MKKEDLERFLDSETKKYRKAEKEEIDSLYSEFLSDAGISSIFKNDYLEIYYCEKVVTQIIEQVRKRMLYFHIYHDIEELNELKETSLYSFWILKLQPFYWKKNGEDKPNYELNAKVALHFFTQGLNLYADKKTAKSENGTVFKPNFNGVIISNLFYSFRFRDWSKEAMMDLAESMICEEPAPKAREEDSDAAKIHRIGG